MFLSSDCIVEILNKTKIMIAIYFAKTGLFKLCRCWDDVCLYVMEGSRKETKSDSPKIRKKDVNSVLRTISHTSHCNLSVHCRL